MEKQLRILCAILFIGSLLFIEQAFAGTVELPRTNSTTCIDSDDKNIACAGTGQDGDKQMGVDIPSSRYISPSPGNIVIDTLTGLVWPKDLGCVNLDRDHWMREKEIWEYKSQTWEDAMRSVANFNDYSFICKIWRTASQEAEAPWRLPNRKELFSMLQYYADKDDRVVGQRVFWTSSTYAYDPEKAWVVKANYSQYGFDKTSLDSVTSDDKSNLNYFWPIRNRTEDD